MLQNELQMDTLMLLYFSPKWSLIMGKLGDWTHFVSVCLFLHHYLYVSVRWQEGGEPPVVPDNRCTLLNANEVSYLGQG